MQAEWQEHIDQLLKEYNRQRANLQRMQETMASLEATVTAADGMITVTVGPQGNLVGLELDPRVYRRLSSTELAEAILAATQEATARLGDQRREAMAPMLPEGGLLGQITGDGPIDPMKFLPERPDDLEAFKERYGIRGK